MEIPLLAVLELSFDKSLFHISGSSNHANCIPDPTEILRFVLHIYAIDTTASGSKMYRPKQIRRHAVVPHSDVACVSSETENTDAIPASKTKNQKKLVEYGQVHQVVVAYLFVCI